MKNLFVLPLVIALSIFCSCQKQQTDAERQAEIDRQVQQRLDAEHQAQEKEQLAQREGELNAREKALAEKENAPAQARESERRSSTIEPRAIQPDEERPTASYNMFYTKLDSYGDWRETSDYGYVWQPREAQSRTWRPYTNGHWVYTDVGWTWVSEEPFGWATYHYGRWTRLRNIGWVWVPGDEWAPAWVSWRKSDEYVGWAPLPPEARFDRRSGIHNWSDSYYDVGPDQYSFVATREFGGERIQRSVVPSERNITIVNQTTNVTNITYSNTTVVNQGPSYDELRTRTQQPIQRLRLEREVNVNINVGEPRPVVRGEVLFIPAPLIARGQAVERPRAVKETVAHVEIDRGWEGIADRQAVEKTRAKMKSESTPPPNAPPRTFVKPAQAASQIGSVSPTLRSTPTPAPTAVATSPVAAPSAIRPAQPKQTAPAKLTQTPRPTVAITPAATPFRREPPKLSLTPPATSSATPFVTPAPAAREMATATPRPAFTPRPFTPTRPPAELSATPSVTPVISGSAPVPPAFDRSAETKEERKAQKELRKEQKVERRKQEFEKGNTPTAETTATPGASVMPSASPSVSVVAPEPPSKQEKKKHKRAGEREESAETAASVSPSPSATPR
jgi:hypothetical protein